VSIIGERKVWDEWSVPFSSHLKIQLFTWKSTVFHSIISSFCSNVFPCRLSGLYDKAKYYARMKGKTSNICLFPNFYRIRFSSVILYICREEHSEMTIDRRPAGYRYRFHLCFVVWCSDIHREHSCDTFLWCVSSLYISCDPNGIVWYKNWIGFRLITNEITICIWRTTMVFCGSFRIGRRNLESGWSSC
jgi:hypothetical protein